MNKSHAQAAEQMGEIDRRISETKKRLRVLLREKRGLLAEGVNPFPIKESAANCEEPERWDGLS